MSEPSQSTAAGKTANTRLARGGILIGGTLIVLIAGGIAMQVWRARTT